MRPVVAGYVAVPAHASRRDAKGEIAAWSQALAGYAHQEGYALGAVFTDVRGRDENGLYGLAEYLRRNEAVGVVVPNLGHLTHVKCLVGADWRTAQRYLRAAVLTVEPQPGDRPKGGRL
jgi:hypothetical protein